MQGSVALVESYLHINGYFTVAEYPVLELLRSGSYREVTDIDLLGFRLPQAGGLVPAKRGGALKSPPFTPDAELDTDLSRPDLIIAEVKEGVAQLNRGSQNPAVLRAVLQRFGCCTDRQSRRVAVELLRKGKSITPADHSVRLMAFGSSPPSSARNYHVISLDHVVRYLQGFLRDHWKLLRHAQISNPVFGFMATLEKARLRAPS